MLILPYFGKFHSYFDLWLKSCEFNRDYDWLLVSDNKNSYEYPSNVHRVNMSFSEFQHFVRSKFDFHVCLKHAYKLCDFKPLYGVLFSEYLSDYDFWGYCDCDTIWGDFNTFLPNDIFHKYDKIFSLGHLCFIRNKAELNELPLQYRETRIVLGKKASYIFDEMNNPYYVGYNAMLGENGYDIFRNPSIIADIDFRNPEFSINLSQEKVDSFEFFNGHIYGWGDFGKKEYLYAHFQKRKMKREPIQDSSHFYVLPNRFVNRIPAHFEIDESVHLDTMESVKRFESFEKNQRILQFLYDPWSIKCRKIFNKLGG